MRTREALSLVCVWRQRAHSLFFGVAGAFFVFWAAWPALLLGRELL